MKKKHVTLLSCFLWDRALSKYYSSHKMEILPPELTWPNPGPCVLNTFIKALVPSHSRLPLLVISKRHNYLIHTFSVIASWCSKSAEWFPSATRSRASNKGFANSVSITFDWERWSLISNSMFSTDKFWGKIKDTKNINNMLQKMKQWQNK